MNSKERLGSWIEHPYVQLVKFDGSIVPYSIDSESTQEEKVLMPNLSRL